MGDFRHIRNGVVISEPRNWDELELSYDFMNRKSDAEISASSLEFAGEVALDIRERIMNGLTGGVGIFEGDPYEIEIGEVGNPVFTFKGYLDYAEGIEFIGCNEVRVALKKRQGEDWLNDVADGFSFRYLYGKGVITNSDFVKVPYIINYIPDGMQLLILGMSMFMMTKELVGEIQAIAEVAGDVTDAATPVVGTSVGLGAGVVTAWDIGNIIMVSLKLAAHLAYTIALVIAIKNLIEQIIEQLVPKKRYHLGMSIYTMFEKACQHLGLNFSSQLLSQRKGWVIIPSKGHRGGEKPQGWKGSWTEKGVPNQDDGMDTFGDLIRTWKKGFNADYKIVNGTFYFEREDFWNTIGNYQMADVFTDQDRLIDRYSPNVEEIIANYSIHWAYDIQDQNTLDNQEGRVFQAITEPNVKQNDDLINLKHLEEVAIGCSLGLRKDSLTKVEEVVKGVAKFIDNLTGMFGGGTSYASQIDARKGSLLLSSHFLTIPKVVVMKGSKLAMNQRSILSAKKLWDDLHYIRSFTEVNGHHNQWLRFETVKVPFCMESFISLMNSNFLNTPDGKEIMIESLKWRIWEDYATINYRVKEKYTNNLKIKYVT